MGLCTKERSLPAVERPHWDTVITATPIILQNMWIEFGHSLNIVLSPGVPALKYSKVGCSQKKTFCDSFFCDDAGWTSV